MEPTTPHEAIPWPTHEDFWLAYDKKRGKPESEKWWNKLTQKEREECMAAVPAYVASTPDKTYRKDPCRYLRHKAFQDEIIAPLPAKFVASTDQYGHSTADALARRLADRDNGR